MDFIHNNPILKNRRRELRKNQTDAEKLLWRYLRNKQFYGLKFFRQYSVGKYILDFYCPKLRLAVEIDGGQHTFKEKKEYDKARSEYLKEYRIEVMRFWNNDVMKDIEGVLNKIAERVTPPNLPLK
jgi:very-short-patch-repair endonuclease